MTTSAILETYGGHLAGVAASALWTATSLFFTAASRRLGVTVVNGGRIILAVGLLTLTYRLTSGAWWPALQGAQLAYLAASGIVGLAIGDQALFYSFLDIGPRRASLVMTTAPLFAAIFGWFALGEVLRPAAWIGVGVCVAGIAWVISERGGAAAGFDPARERRGYGLALIYAVCQAGGMLLSKQGMGHGWLPKAEMLSPQPASLVRMSFAALAMLPLLGLHVWRERRLSQAGRPTVRYGTAAAGAVLALGGTIVGPYLGVWMSLVASDRAPLGIAQTCCSLTPLFILPVAAIVEKERITLRAALGALLAVGGLAVLFLA